MSRRFAFEPEASEVYLALRKDPAAPLYLAVRAVLTIGLQRVLLGGGQGGGAVGEPGRHQPVRAPVPLCVEFPFPAWATRPAEAGATPSATMRSITQAADPFAVVGATPQEGYPF